MKNPNDCTTEIIQTSNEMIMNFVYTSASVANHDFASIQDTYSHAKSVEKFGKTITVVIALITDEISRPCKTARF
jgi:hypothetical protein